MTGPVTTDMAKVRQRNMVDAEIALHLRNYQTSGAELIMGTGRFVAPRHRSKRTREGPLTLTHSSRALRGYGL